MTGALPPSSRCVRLTVLAAACSTFLPVAMSPVIEIMSTPGWLISALPTLSPRPTMTLTTPSGRISARILRQLQRGQRRLLGRLDDHGVAAGDRRGELPGHHHQRVVPRRDGADDADRVAADHRGVPGHVFAGHRRRACCAPRRRRSGSSRRWPGISSLRTALIGLPQFSASSAAKSSASASMRVGDGQQLRRALGRRGARPAGKGAARRRRRRGRSGRRWPRAASGWSRRCAG